MTEYIGFPYIAQRIKFKGVIDWDEVYRVSYDWLISRGYEVHETKYKEKEASPIGPEYEADWQAWKRITEIYKWWIYIHYHFWDVHDVEIIKGGKKKKAIKGRMMALVYGKVEVDYTQQFEAAKWQKHLETFLLRYVWKKKLEGKWEDKLRFKVYELTNVMKTALGMEIKGSEFDDIWMRGFESAARPIGKYT